MRKEILNCLLIGDVSEKEIKETLKEEREIDLLSRLDSWIAQEPEITREIREIQILKADDIFKADKELGKEKFDMAILIITSPTDQKIAKLQEVVKKNPDTAFVILSEPTEILEPDRPLAEIITEFFKMAVGIIDTSDALGTPESERIEIEERLERDKEAFLRMKESLIKEYLNEYVAIINGKIIAHHRNVDELIKRLDEEVGPVPLFISKVEREPSPVRLPSPRLNH